jgi:hypothetical protein
MTGILKVDTIQNANASNIVTQTNSTTITIGTSGQTVALASGASSSGFGATYNGAVNWSTTVRTSGFTAVSGNGYFVNTTSAEVTVTLPASPSAGAIVAIKDYAATSGTNNIIIGANGSKINGGTLDYKINTNGNSVTFIYIDSTQGWLIVYDGLNSSASADSDFIIATGGTVYTCGDYKVHAFNSTGCFVVQNGGTPIGSTTVDYMVVAGGGGSSLYALGAGGAGGFRMSTALPVSVATYPVTIGAGGVGATPSAPNSNGSQGGNSIFSTITSSGGGAGGNFNTPGPVATDGSAGGSGGGIGRDAYLAGRTSANNGNLPSVSPSQGNPGGVYAYGPSGTQGAAGGGGASASGGNGSPGNGAGPGGAGSPAAPVFGAAPKPYYQANNPLNGPTSTGIFAGGGGSASYPCGSGGGTGGPGGGGNGKPSPGNGNNGLANTGGGGGASFNCNSGSGGSGVVLIRYKYQ